MQDQDEKSNVPLLKSSISSNKPLLTVSHMNELVDTALRCTDKLNEITSSKNGDYSYMTLAIDQIAVEMVNIQTQMQKFQPAEVLEQCIRHLKGKVDSARYFIQNAQAQLLEQANFNHNNYYQMR